MLVGNLPHGQAFFVAFVTCCLKGAVMICDMNCLTRVFRSLGSDESRQNFEPQIKVKTK